MRASVAVMRTVAVRGLEHRRRGCRGALGRPSILSDFPVHLEQDPPGARFFPVGDAEALAGLLAEANDLAPGPDPMREASARADGRARLEAFGGEFLALARSG